MKDMINGWRWTTMPSADNMGPRTPMVLLQNRLCQPYARRGARWPLQIEGWEEVDKAPGDKGAALGGVRKAEGKPMEACITNSLRFEDDSRA